MKSISNKVFDYKLFKRLFAYSLPYKKPLYLAIFLTLSIAILSPARPWLIQFTIDHVILNYDSNQLSFLKLFISTDQRNALLILTIVMIIILMLQALVQYYHTYLTQWLGQTIVKDIRVKVYSHIIRLRSKYFDKNPIGTLVTRCVSDIETIADVFSEGVIIIISNLLQLVVIILVMFYTDWELTLISLSILPILIYSSYIFKEKVKISFQDVRTQVARLNAFIQEHVTGMSVIQIFNREEVEMKKFKEINREHMEAHVKTIWYYSVFFPIVEILSAAAMFLMVWWGAKGVLNNELSLGVLIAFLLYINMLFRPIRELADKFNTFQMGMVASERIFKILDTKEVIENKGVIKSKEIYGNIQFKNVFFAYNKEDYVLKNLSFEIDSGKVLAIVGTTGAGKSSIINVLGRFYEYNKGEILIDGNNIRDLELSHLRSSMAVVLQDVFLFSDTISNNISLNDLNVSRKKIEEAAMLIEADQFIKNFSGNYDYNVKERGTTLSVGQRQIISFIRALVYNPKILILDEATSSIDTETERLIQNAIRKLIKNRTSIVIAHRLSTIQNADKIIVLDHGEVKECGTHQKLLSIDGLYRKLYEVQFESVV